MMYIHFTIQSVYASKCALPKISKCRILMISQKIKNFKSLFLPDSNCVKYDDGLTNYKLMDRYLYKFMNNSESFTQTAQKARTKILALQVKKSRSGFQILYQLLSSLLPKLGDLRKKYTTNIIDNHHIMNGETLIEFHTRTLLIERDASLSLDAVPLVYSLENYMEQLLMVPVLQPIIRLDHQKLLKHLKFYGNNVTFSNFNVELLYADSLELQYSNLKLNILKESKIPFRVEQQKFYDSFNTFHHSDTGKSNKSLHNTVKVCDLHKYIDSKIPPTKYFDTIKPEFTSQEIESFNLFKSAFENKNYDIDNDSTLFCLDQEDIMKFMKIEEKEYILKAAKYNGRPKMQCECCGVIGHLANRCWLRGQKFIPDNIKRRVVLYNLTYGDKTRPKTS